MAIKVVLNLNVNETKVQEYKQFLSENLPNVRNFEGCKMVDVYFNAHNNEMAIDEIWESKQSHQKYIEFISSNGIMGELVSFLSTEPEIKYFDILEV